MKSSAAACPDMPEYSKPIRSEIVTSRKKIGRSGFLECCATYMLYSTSASMTVPSASRSNEPISSVCPSTSSPVAIHLISSPAQIEVTCWATAPSPGHMPARTAAEQPFGHLEATLHLFAGIERFLEPLDWHDRGRVADEGQVRV